MDNYILLKGTDNFATISHFSPSIFNVSAHKVKTEIQGSVPCPSPSDVFAHSPVLLISLKLIKGMSGNLVIPHRIFKHNMQTNDTD